MLNQRAHDQHMRNANESLDHEPHRVPPLFLERLAGTAPHAERVTEADKLHIVHALKQSVKTNLEALLNCPHFGSHDELADWPHVSASTLNYGVPPLAGRVLSEVYWHEIESAITLAIVRFEPRIIPAGLTIGRADGDLTLARHNMLAFDIQGQLRWSPAPVEFVFTSRVDLENGHFELVDKE